jgi:hypothetical protein
VTQKWPEPEAFDFYYVNDERAGIYKAFLANTERVRLSYVVVAADRLMLLATSVLPTESRQLDTSPELMHRVLNELIACVLDDVRESGRKIIVICPVVDDFITRNPQHIKLIDDTQPGSAAHRT